MKTSLKIFSHSLFNYSFLLLLLTIGSPPSRAEERVLWRETFEGQADLWTADRGGWQFGEITNPVVPKPIEGRRAAAVGLHANHPAALSTSFIRDEYFTVPAAEENPRLRFYHWFSTYGGDFGQVRIRQEGGDPEALSDSYSGVSPWTKASLSLAKYAGKKIRVEFYFTSNSDALVSAGWFIDDIALVIGEYEFQGFEGFEGPELWSFRNWACTRGNWQTGKPTQGPGSAHSGTNCAAVNLTAAHPSLVDSTLFSPPFVVPSSEQNPQLRFYHWFSTYGGDFGEVRIREEGGEPQVISPRYEGVSDWAKAVLSLTNFANKKVRIEFYFASNGDALNSSGWFVDDVEVSTGDFRFQGTEGFEGEARDWTSTRGNWQIGKPTSGPGAAFAGTNCAAVRLSAAHPSIVDSSLVSPPFLVPSADQNPRLRFQHWFSTYNGDFGEVRIRDESGLVTTNGGPYSGVSDWTRVTLALSEVAGKTVQIEFHFASNSDALNSAGWFIDDVELLSAASQNHWPVLQPIGAQIAPAAGAVSFTAKAIDADVGQSLIYSIDASTAIAGASINPQTGAFTWEPAAAQRGGGSYYVRVRASDSGNPVRSTSELVPIIFPGAIRLQQSHNWEPFYIKMVGGVPGLLYSNYAVADIQGNSLAADSSPVLITNLIVRARGDAAYFSDATTNGHRFFIINGRVPAPAP